MGEVIKLEFKSFDVVAFTCNLGDYVEVRDGQVWQSAVVINQYCNGNKPPTAIYSRSANLLVRFKSDDIIDGVGFQAEYKAVVPGKVIERLQLAIHFLSAKKPIYQN